MPLRQDKFLKKLQDQVRLQSMIRQRENNLSFQLKKKVMQNVYRKRYDIPVDLMVRKEDPDIRAAVNSSEALQRVQQMEVASISPQLIFFEKGLPE